ncbi:MAG: hypothetical protein HY066_02390 [Betaproteobacteria bacterium]|nr:hypothetical protein [Betaproteobacteria bacterium]
MPYYYDYVFDQLLVPALILFFFIGGVFSVVIGVGLIVSSEKVFRLFGLMNYSVSTRRVMRPMAVQRDSGNFVWKHRRMAGAIFVAGAAYAVYGLIARVDGAAVVSLINLKFPPQFVLWLVQSVRIFLIAGCIISITVGLLLAFFPDAMRAIELRSSLWHSTRKIAPDADKMNFALDNWVATSPRLAGWIILFPALGMVGYFGSLLLGRI